MPKATALKYTADEKRAVEAGWWSLLRAVECSHIQERRVNDAVKSRKAGGVTQAGARAFIMRTVQGAQRQLGPDNVHLLSVSEDDEILCYFVGAWIKRRTESGEYPAAIWDDITAALKAHDAAHRRYLDGVAGR